MKISINWGSVTPKSSPIAELRAQLSMSRKSMAEAAGIPYNTLHFAESGILANLPGTLHMYFNTRFTNYSEHTLTRIYYDWINLSRHHVHIPPVAENITATNLNLHPFQQYLGINNYTIMGFCTLIKIPKNVIYHYIKPGMQERMPVTVATALKQCGMKQADIDLLDALGRSHYNNVLKARIDERRAYVSNGDRAAG